MCVAEWALETTVPDLPWTAEGHSSIGFKIHKILKLCSNVIPEFCIFCIFFMQHWHLPSFYEQMYFVLKICICFDSISSQVYLQNVYLFIFFVIISTVLAMSSCLQQNAYIAT